MTPMLLLCAVRAGIAAPVATVLAAPVAGPAAVTADRLRLRVSWTGGGTGRVEVQDGARWRPAAAPGASPATTRPLPVGAQVRVVVGDAASDPVHAPGIWTPADVAAWSGTGLRGATVLGLDVQDDHLWVASAGGGIAAWDGHAWTGWDRRSGLPSDVAYGIDAAPGGTWVATQGGAVRLADGTIARTWTAGDGLPASAVRAVRIAGHATWIATDRGLARIDGDTVRTVLTGACQALMDAPTGPGVWAACPRLVTPDGTPIPGAGADLAVLDATPGPKGPWIATAAHGLLRLVEGVAFPEWRPVHGEVDALAPTSAGLVAAAGPDGVWQRRAAGWVRHGLSEGLPSTAAWSVIPGPPDKVWVGTGRGAALLDLSGRATALPLAPLPADEPVAGVVPARHGLAVAAEDGPVWLGDRPPRGWSALVAAVAGPPAALERVGDDWWVLDGASALHLDARGHLERWRLPARGTALAPTAKSVALATADGVQIWLPGATQLSPAVPVIGVRAIRTGWGGGLWIAGRDAVVRLGPSGPHAWRDVAGPRDVATTPSAAWVAADGGLYRIDARGEAKSASLDWKAGAFVAVATWDDAVWAAGADGRVWGPNPAHPVAVDLARLAPGVRVEALRAVPEGVWVATDAGLFFVDGRVHR